MLLLQYPSVGYLVSKNVVLALPNLTSETTQFKSTIKYTIKVGEFDMG